MLMWGACTLLGCLIALILSVFLVVPVSQLMPPAVRLSSTDMPSISTPLDDTNTLLYSGEFPGPFLDERVTIRVGPLGYVLVLSPSQSLSESYNGTDDLIGWYSANKQWFDEALLTYGGVVFRGFGVQDVHSFDKILGKFHEDLHVEVYLGTAPRRRINGTQFVSSASEIGRLATIPTHLELPYTAHPPRRIYFFAQQPNPPPGGQTVLTDFRQVWRDLPQEYKNNLVSRGLTYHRWYYNKARRNYDILKSKSWQEMFETDDRDIVDSAATKQGFNTTWTDDGDLLLHHKALVFRRHEVTGDEYLNLHFNVLHGATFSVPFAWSAQLFDSKESASLAIATYLYNRARIYMGYGYGHDMVYSDDNSEVSWNDAMILRRTISRNSWIYDHRAGDVVMLDNHRIAHGRSPWFTGQRKVYVALYH